MATVTIPFAGGFLGTNGYGQQSKIKHAGTWAAGDDWTIPVSALNVGSFTVGKGNIAEQTYTTGFKLRNRAFVAFGSSFALSAIDDITLWEDHNTGAAVIQFLSQYGAQDSVTAFGAFQGKLVVFGRKSIQIWQVDSDPAKFALLQTLDNCGTQYQKTVWPIGDLDVYYLEASGIRSIKSKEFTANAYVNDTGIAIDSVVRLVLADLENAPCSVVEPTLKQYWIYLSGDAFNKIYVFSNFPPSKIAAWSTLSATYLSAGSQVAFVPEKFIVHAGFVYCRVADDNLILQYQSTTYDNKVVTVELPWLNMDSMNTEKSFQSVEAVMAGNWSIGFGTNPLTTTYPTYISRGTGSTPNVTNDSTTVVRRFPVNGTGVYAKLVFTSDNTTPGDPKKLCSCAITYKNNREK